MLFVSKRLIVPSLAIPALFAFVCFAADKDIAFSAKPVSAYPARQANDKVTIAAVPFDTDALAQSAFGKSNPNRFGVLPMLIVIQNDGSQSIQLENIRVEYMTPDRKHVEATPAKFNEVAKFEAIEGKTWAHPVLVRGHLLVEAAGLSLLWCCGLGHSAGRRGCPARWLPAFRGT